MDTLIKVCKFYFDKNDAISFISGASKLADGSIDEKNAIYISDLADDVDYFALLLVRGDPGRSLPSFVNPKTRVVKPVSPQDAGDVPGASAHVVISKAAIAAGGDQGRHRMAIERATGLSKTLARDFLTHLMGRYAEEHPHEFMRSGVRTRRKSRRRSHIALHADLIRNRTPA